MGRTDRVLFVLLAVKWLENECHSFANDRVHFPARPFPPSDGHWDREPLWRCPECVMIECMDRRRVREVASLIWRRHAASLWRLRMFPRGNRSVDNPHLQRKKENLIDQARRTGYLDILGWRLLRVRMVWFLVSMREHVGVRQTMREDLNSSKVFIRRRGWWCCKSHLHHRLWSVHSLGTNRIPP